MDFSDVVVLVRTHSGTVPTVHEKRFGAAAACWLAAGLGDDGLYCLASQAIYVPPTGRVGPLPSDPVDALARAFGRVLPMSFAPGAGWFPPARDAMRPPEARAWRGALVAAFGEVWAGRAAADRGDLEGWAGVAAGDDRIPFIVHPVPQLTGRAQRSAGRHPVWLYSFWHSLGVRAHMMPLGMPHQPARRGRI